MPEFRINRVYTRSGDKGFTALIGGERVSKSSVQVAAYGDVDELNSHLGLLRAVISSNPQPKEGVDLGNIGALNFESSELELLQGTLEDIQQDLFDLGAQLATPADQIAIYSIPLIGKSHIEFLENRCDFFNENLPELRSFVLPGDTELSALFHIARAVCRRAERTVTEQASQSGLNESTQEDYHPLVYLNRLSDLLFILSRWVVKQSNCTEKQWVVGRRR